MPSAPWHNRLEGTALRTPTLLAIALILGAMHPSRTAAHRFGHPTVAVNELQFGMGWVGPRDDTVFNIEFDSSLDPTVAYQFTYYNNTTDRVAFGLHLYWSRQHVDPLTVEDDVGNVFDVFLRVDSYNLGPRARYTFRRGLVSPYVYGGMSYAFGSVTGNDRDFQRLRYDGFTLTGAGGLSLRSAAWLDVAVEAFYLGGWASWNDYPFLNSTSRDFDPSMLGVLGNVTLRF